MKTGIILRVLWPAGGPRTAIEEASHLSRMGHRVTLIICRESGYRYQYQDLLSHVPDVRVVTRGLKGLLCDVLSSPIYAFMPPGVRGRESKIDIPTLLTLPLSLQKSSYDVLVCHDQFAGISGYLAKTIKGIPYVVRVHEKPTRFGGIAGRPYGELGLRGKLLYGILNRIERRIFGQACCLVANSKQCAEHMRTYLQGQHRIEVVYPGGNPVCEPCTDRRNYVLALSRWDVMRKPEFILDIAARVGNTTFVLAGAFTPPALEWEFRKQVARRGLVDRVKIVRHLREKTINELYNHASAYIRWGDEAFGAGVIEAASHACPVVVQKQAGASELVEHGVHGFVVDGLDVAGFADYVGQLLGDPQSAAKMGFAAWEMSRHYSWEAHAVKLRELLEEVLAHRSSR